MLTDTIENKFTHSEKETDEKMTSFVNRGATMIKSGGSPGLVVMGGDSRFKGHGFESRHHILDGHFFT